MVNWLFEFCPCCNRIVTAEPITEDEGEDVLVRELVSEYREKQKKLGCFRCYKGHLLIPRYGIKSPSVNGLPRGVTRIGLSQ